MIDALLVTSDMEVSIQLRFAGKEYADFSEKILISGPDKYWSELLQQGWSQFLSGL